MQVLNSIKIDKLFLNYSPALALRLICAHSEDIFVKFKTYLFVKLAYPVIEIIIFFTAKPFPDNAFQVNHSHEKRMLKSANYFRPGKNTNYHVIIFI